MVVCLAYRHILGIIILVAMKEKGLPFTVTVSYTHLTLPTKRIV